MLVYTVIVASFLGGVAIGGLLCFRHWRTGMLALPATCAGVALIMVMTEIAEGDHTTSGVLTAAGLAFVPVIGTVLACVIIGTAWLLWAIFRRVPKAIGTFGGNVLTDFLRIVKRRSNKEDQPWALSKASLITLRFLAAAGLILFLLNIGALWHLTTLVMPRLSIVTNVLDLISLVLVTPKLSELLPPRTLTFVFRGALFLSLYVLLLLALAIFINYTIPQFLELIGTVNKIFHSRLLDYLWKHILETQMVNMQIWPFAKSITIVTVFLAASMMLVSPPAETSPEAQQRRSDKLLCWGVVVFAYSRALSMLG
jgi:hypothetical protein